MRILVENVSPEDAVVLKKQLNTSELYVFGIAKRCIYGYPSIAVLNPVFDDSEKTINYTALKNTLWLTCPFLNRKIHTLEGEGNISKIQSFLNSDREFLGKMQDANAHYYFFRKEVYFESSRLEFNDSLAESFNSGVGGIKDVSSIKCLHMHYAHYQFCSSNLAGHITELMLNNEISCNEELCKCSSC
ncbi:MAG: DUF501 domain-containing protein [Spirochaetes bacterium]|nr:DUF501 domain-containing protein [Spirochaetota bacterium]